MFVCMGDLLDLYLKRQEAVQQASLLRQVHANRSKSWLAACVRMSRMRNVVVCEMMCAAATAAWSSRD